MKNTLSITETNDELDSSSEIERLRIVLDEITPAQIQQVLAVLYRTPRKPRSDRGAKKGEQS